MLNVINAEWDTIFEWEKMSTGNNAESNKRPIGHNVEW